MARTGLGEYDAGLRVLEEAFQLCEKLDNELEFNRLLHTLGMVHMQCGAFDAGLDFSRQGLEIARRSRHATGFERVAFNLVDQADGFLTRGAPALAADVPDEAVHIVQHPPEARWMTWRYETHCWVSLGELALARGDDELAERHANQALEIAVPTRSRKYESRAWRLKLALGVDDNQLPAHAPQQEHLALTGNNPRLVTVGEVWWRDGAWLQVRLICADRGGVQNPPRRE